MDKQLYPVEQKLVEFEGAELLGVKANDGKVYVGVSYICNGIGLSEKQKDRQVSNVQEDLVLKHGTMKLPLKFGGQVREVQTIELDFLPLWLAKISITPSMQEDTPEVTGKLVTYQLKAKDVLAAAFLKPNGKAKSAGDDKRLDREIKLKNANSREASILLKVADMDTTEDTYRKVLRAKAVEVVTGERLLPMPKVERATYTATEAAGKLGMSSANAAGTLANRLGIKPPQGEENEFGEWIHTKSQHGPKQVKSFMYTDAAIERMREAIESGE